MATLNYSPFTYQDFPWTIDSKLLQDPPVWNMAWLSWDLSQGPHPDPKFSSACYHSVNQRLDGSGRAISGTVPDHLLVRSLMTKPPQDMVDKLVQSPAFPKLEMFQAYGPAWVSHFMATSMRWQDSLTDHSWDDVKDILRALALSGRF